MAGIMDKNSEGRIKAENDTLQRKWEMENSGLTPPEFLKKKRAERKVEKDAENEEYKKVREAEKAEEKRYKESKKKNPPSDIKVKDGATSTGSKPDVEARINELIEELGEDEEAIYSALLDEGYTEDELDALDLGGEEAGGEDVDANGIPDIDDLDDEDKQVIRETYGAIFPGDPDYPAGNTDETSTFSGEASSGNPLAKLLGGLKF
jgi:hypothetical protein